MSLLALTLLLSVSAAPPATSVADPLTLDEVWRRVDALHPSVIAAGADVEAGEGLALAAEGAFDPTLKAGTGGDFGNYTSAQADVGAGAFLPLLGARVDGGWRLGLGDYPIYGGKDKTSDFGEVALGVRVPLLRDLFLDDRRGGVMKQGLEVQRRRAAQDAVRLELQRAAAKSWFDWMAAGARLKVAEDLLSLAETRDGQLKRRADAGDIPSIEVADNARLIAQRRARLISAQRTVERTALALALSLRDDDGRPQPPPRERLPAVPQAWQQERPEDVDVEAVVELARQQRPELVAARQALEQALVDQRLADNQLLPQLSVGAKVSQDLGDTHPPLSSSSSVWNPDPKTRSLPDAAVDLRFEVPVPQRVARGRSQAAEAAVRRATATMQLLEDRIVLEARDAWQARRAALLRAAAAVLEVEAAESVLVGERQRFEAGDSTLVVVNLREVALAEAQLAAAEAQIEVAHTDVALRLIAGTVEQPR